MSVMTDQIPVLDTPRLTLRAPMARDLPTLTAFYETTRSHAVGGPRNAEESFMSLTSRIGHWAIKGFGLWHIDDRANGDFLGWVGILDAPSWDEPELAWTVFAHGEGKGMAFEAATAARAYAAQHMKMDQLISYIRPENTRSIALAERLGAVLEHTKHWRGKDCHVYRHPSQLEAT